MLTSNVNPLRTTPKQELSYFRIKEYQNIFIHHLLENLLKIGFKYNRNIIK